MQDGGFHIPPDDEYEREMVPCFVFVPEAEQQGCGFPCVCFLCLAEGQGGSQTQEGSQRRARQPGITPRIGEPAAACGAPVQAFIGPSPSHLSREIGFCRGASFN